jgi:hypothetical protein
MMILCGWVHMDHDVADTRVFVEYPFPYLGRYMVRFPDRHRRIHIQLDINDKVLTGPANTDLVNPIHPMNASGRFSDRGHNFSGRRRVHEIVTGAPEGLPAYAEDEKGGQSRRSRIQTGI